MSNFISLFNSSVGDFDQFFYRTLPVPGYFLQCTDIDGTGKWADISESTVTGITGTSNQVLVNNTSSVKQIGDVTLTLPQSIATNSAVEFKTVMTTEVLLDESKIYNPSSGIIVLESNDIPAMTVSNSSVLIGGNLQVDGTLTYLNTETFEVKDNLINIGYGNPLNTVDLGMLFSYNQSTTPRWSAIYKLAGTNKFMIKNNLTTLPTSVVGSQGDLADLELNDITLSSINSTTLSPTVWPFVSTLNQNLSTTSSPTFVNVTANLIGSATTVTAASQPSITTLPNLTSIQGQAISSVVWPFVSTLNQNLSTTSSPTFVTVTANLLGNATTSTTVTAASQPSITTLPNLTSIQGQAISSVVWPFVSTLNQNLSTTSSPTFVTVNGTAGSFSNTVSATNQVSSKNGVFSTEVITPLVTATTVNATTVNATTFSGSSATAVTVTGAAQPAITSVGVLTGITTSGTIVNTAGIGVTALELKKNSSAGSTRWVSGLTDAESGGSTGSNFALFSCSDLGVVLTPPALKITRATNNQLSIGGPVNLIILNDNTNGNLTSGTYSPAMSNGSNLSTFTNGKVTYMRIGNIVEVRITATATSTSTTSSFGILVSKAGLPSTTTLTVTGGTGGIVVSGFAFTIANFDIYNSTTNVRADFYTSVAIASGNTVRISFSFSYEIN